MTLWIVLLGLSATPSGIVADPAAGVTAGLRYRGIERLLAQFDAEHRRENEQLVARRRAQ